MKKKQVQTLLFVAMLVIICVFFGKKGYTELKNQRENETEKQAEINQPEESQSIWVQTDGEEESRKLSVQTETESGSEILYKIGETASTFGMEYTVTDYRIWDKLPEEVQVDEDLCDFPGYRGGQIEDGYSVVEVSVHIHAVEPELEEVYLNAILLMEDGDEAGRNREVFASDKKDGLYTKSYYMIYPEPGDEYDYKLYYIIKNDDWDVDKLYVFVHNQGAQKYTDKARRIYLRY